MTTDHCGYEKEQQPDIVEVIRCKYCDHWNRFTEDFFGECDAGCGVHDEQFFCSDGERREKWSNILKAE